MAGRLEDRICLVTGASRGIGRAVAKLFAAEGATVVALARTQAALEELDDEVRGEGGKPLVLVPEDLTDFDKIDQIGGGLYQRFGKLDVMVANHGILGTLTPTQQIKPAEWQKVIDANLTSCFRMIRSFEPLLRQSDAGRAIFVTTGAVPSPRGYWASYAASKAGMETLVMTWADELRKTDIRVNLLDPGRTRTAMRAKAFPQEDPNSLPTPADKAPAFLELAVPDCARHGERVQA